MQKYLHKGGRVEQILVAVVVVEAVLVVALVVVRVVVGVSGGALLVIALVEMLVVVGVSGGALVLPEGVVVGVVGCVVCVQLPVTVSFP